MEILTLTTIVVLSIALGFVASRVVLDMLFIAMRRSIHSADTATSETRHEQSAIRVTAPAA